jgi:hypothetical protein
MQSNLAIAEELMRISEYLEPRAPVKPPEPKEPPPGIWPTTWFDGRNEKPLLALRREGSGTGGAAGLATPSENG